MATKFSDFTAQAATGTTFVVGYDGTTNTQYSQDNLTNFVLDGTLTAARTLKLDGNNLIISSASGFPLINTAKFSIYPNGNSNALSTRAAFSSGNIDFNYLGHNANSIGLNFISYNTSIRAYGFGFYGGGAFSTNGGYSVIGPDFTYTSGNALTAKLGIIGKHNDNTSYALRVQNSDNEDMFFVRNDKYTTVNLNNGIPNGFMIKNEATWTMLDAGDSGNNVGQLRLKDNNNERVYLNARLGVQVANSGNAAIIPSGSLFAVTSTDKGFLPPRNADPASNISSPTTGLIAYNSTSNKLQFYNGTAWTDAAGSDSIYTADGSISENRILTIANNGNVPYSVNFKGNSGAAGAGPVFIQIENERLDGAYSTNSGAQLKLKGGSSSGSLNTDLDIIAHGSNYGGSSAPQVHFNSNRGYTFTAGTGGSSTSNGVSQDLVLRSGSTGQIIVSTTTNFGNNTNTTIAMVGGGGGSSSMIQMGKTGNDIGKFFRGSANGVLQIGKHSGGAYGSAGTTTTEIYVDGSSNVGIGDNTTINARLHVKGSGATNATTALLVEDSSGNDIIKALDDRTVRLGYNANQITTESSNGGKVRLNNVTGDPLFSASIVSGSTGKINVYGGYYNTFEYAASKGLVFTNEAGFNVAQDASSMLTCVSSTKGFLPPRMTTTQRDAINSGTFTTGLTLYNTTDNKLQFYNGSAWTDAGGGGDNIYTADGTLSGNRTVTIPANGNITFSSTGGFSFYVGQIYMSPYGEVRAPSAGRFKINSFSTELVANYLRLYNANYITGTTTGFVTVSGTTAITHSINARLGVIGKSATSTTDYAFRVQDSAAADMFSLRDDGAFALGKGASYTNSTPNTSVIIGNSALATSNNSVVIGASATTTSGGQSGVIIGANASLAANNSFGVAIGANANVTGTNGTAIGYSSKAGGNGLAIGRDAEATGSKSITLSASGGISQNTTDTTFDVYMSNVTTPDLKFRTGDNVSYWNPAGETAAFGFSTTSPTATVDIDGTFRLRSASNVSGKVLTADANGNGTWQTAGGGSAGENLLAITSITGSGGSQVQHDVKVYSSTTSNNFAAINFNSDETARFAKIVFTPTGTVAKVIFRALGKDIGGNGDTWLGLHSSSSQTASPAYGWFLVNKDAESDEYEHVTAEWLLTGLTANQQITAYVMGIASLSGCTFYARELNTGAWNSTGDTTAFPATVEAYDVSVTITSNPSS